MSNLPTRYYFKLDFQKWTKLEESPNTSKSISSKACNFPVEYPNRESKHGIKESEPVIIVNPVIILSTLLPRLIQ